MGKLRTNRWTCVLAITGAALVLLGIKYMRKYFIWDNFGTVVPGRVYRSGRLTPSQLQDAITRYGIQPVLNLNHAVRGKEKPVADAEEQLVQGLGLKYFKARWSGDGVVPVSSLRWAHELISDADNQPVLIHCARGSSRTGAVVAYYRIWTSHWSRQQIRDEMVQYGHRPGSNQQLERLIDRLFVSYQEAGVEKEPAAARY